jgi:hypothetical protein
MAEESRGPLTSTQPKPFIFILMPFEHRFDDIYKYGIKGAADDAGAYAERIDEQIFTEGILDRIYTQIDKADVIVADMTDRNPNVFYEVGYAHALGKVVLLLTQKTTDIPFDLQHHQHIVYEGKIELLRTKLVPRLKWAIEQASAIEADEWAERFSLRFHGVEAIKGLSTDLPVLGGMTTGRSFKIVAELRNEATEMSPPITHIYLFARPGAKLFPTEVTTGSFGTFTTTLGSEPGPEPLLSLKASPLDASDGLTTQYKLPIRFPALPPGAVELKPLDFALTSDSESCDEPLRFRLYGESGYHDFGIRVELTLESTDKPKK